MDCFYDLLSIQCHTQYKIYLLLILFICMKNNIKLKAQSEQSH